MAAVFPGAGIVLGELFVVRSGRADSRSFCGTAADSCDEGRNEQDGAVRHVVSCCFEFNGQSLLYRSGMPQRSGMIFGACPEGADVVAKQKAISFSDIIAN